MLADALTGTDHYLPLSVRVQDRTHRAYIEHQPNATSVADDGTIVGNGTVRFEAIEEEVAPNNWVTYEPPATTFSFIWDSWNVTPRILAHSPNALLLGSNWNEYAQISSDGVVQVRQRTNNSLAGGLYRFQRFGGVSTPGTTGPYNVYITARTGEQGVQAFNIADGSNGFCWLPTAEVPHSVLAESTFKTFNSRSFFIPLREPAFIGVTPGALGKYCLNFWDKTMIRHEDRWQEAIEIGDATLMTPKGVAFRSRIPNSVTLWQGGQTISLINAVPNKDFSGSSVFPLDATSDGRVLINHYSQTEANSYGFLVPIDIDEVIADQIPGSFDNQLPSPYFGGNPDLPRNGFANNPMLMATQSGQQAKLRVRVAVADPQIYVGARIRQTTAILGSASASSPVVDLTFNVPSFSKNLYDIVAGYDSNSNSALDGSEVRVVFEKTPRMDKEGYGSTANLQFIDKVIVVDSDQATWARTELVAGSIAPGAEFTGDLAQAFVQGSTTVPDATTTPTVPITSSQPGLSHPLGAVWNPAGEANTHRFTFGDGSPASDQVETSHALEQIVGKIITLNKTALLSAHPGTDEYITSGYITFTNEEKNFNETDPEELPGGIPELGFAFGKVSISGTIRVSYKKSGSFLFVGSVEAIGSFDDLYDFAWGTGGWAQTGAIVQAAHATLASSTYPQSGKVFFTRLEFNSGFVNTWNGTF